MAIKFRKGLESERIQLSGGTYDKPDTAEPLWTTDTKKFYIGDGTGATAGGVFIGPITGLSQLTVSAHTHPELVSPYTSVVFDRITATSITTTGSSIRTTSLTASTATATTATINNLTISGTAGITTLAFGIAGGYTNINAVHTLPDTLYMPSMLSTGNLSAGSVYLSSTLSATTISAATKIYSGSVDVAALIAAGGGPGVSDHGALTGLFDNDHPQYRMTSSTEVVSATTFYSGANDVSKMFSPTGHTHQFSAITSTGHSHNAMEITGGTIPASRVSGGTFAAGAAFTFGSNVIITNAAGLVVNGDNVYLNNGGENTSGGLWISGGSGQFYYTNLDKRWVMKSSGGTANSPLFVEGAITGTSLCGATIIGTTYSGFTPPMMSGGPGCDTVVALPAFFGTYSGNSVVGVGNHFFIDNNLSPTVNPTAYWRYTGNTKWGIEVSGTTLDLNIYKVGSHNGIINMGLSGVKALGMSAASWYTNSTKGYLLNDADYSNVTGMTYASFEPTGFINTNTDASLGFTSATRTFGITPTGASFDVMVNGRLYTKSAVENVVISDEWGLHHIVYNPSGVLTDLGTGASIYDFIYNNAYVANVYWDKALSQATGVGDERHGTTMDPDTHKYLHLTVGSRYYSGFQPFGINADVTPAGSVNDQSAVVGIGAGVFYDEDIKHEKALSDTGATIPVVYMTGETGQWRLAPTRIHPLFTGGSGGLAGGPAYNGYNGAKWGMSGAASADYVLYHFFGANSISGSVIAIPGQTSYASAAAARTAANAELESLVTTGLPFQEFIPICTVIFQAGTTYGNLSKARIVTTDTGAQYVDWRESVLPTGAANFDHGALNGLGDDDHTQYLNEGRLTGTTHAILSSITATISGDTVTSLIRFGNGAGDLINNYIGYVAALGAITIYPSLRMAGNISAATVNATSVTGTTFSGITSTKSLTIPDVRANENVTMFYLNRNVTFKNAWIVLSGLTPSVTWALVSGSSKGAAGGTITGATTAGAASSGVGVTHTIASRSVPAGNWIWLTTSATGGTTNEFHITVEFTEL